MTKSSEKEEVIVCIDSQELDTFRENHSFQLNQFLNNAVWLANRDKDLFAKIYHLLLIY